jgi:hypothetical protein
VVLNAGNHSGINARVSSQGILINLHVDTLVINRPKMGSFNNLMVAPNHVHDQKKHPKSAFSSRSYSVSNYSQNGEEDGDFNMGDIEDSNLPENFDDIEIS